jgi:hypothetical protein
MTMLFSTTTQYVVLVLVLIAGWFFGLASSSGGARWRERYAAERDAHAAARRDLDARRADADKRVADAERVHRDRAAASDARIVELERENERLRTAAPVSTMTVRPTPVSAPAAAPTRAPSTMPPIARDAAVPAYPDGTKRGWFDFGR